MKKILFLIMFICIASLAEGSTLTVPTLSSDSDVNLNYFNNFSSAVESVINGNIETGNIKDGTILVDDMAASSSPAQREGDHFNAYTKSGMLPVTSSSLTSNISAGTSYVESDAGLLYRVVTSATSKTYTASKDTWVYIDKNGAFQYSAVTVGAAQPTTPADSLLLATVTTDGTTITTVTDRRTLSISLGNNEDYIIKGFEINADNGAICSADAGVVYHGSTRIEKTTFTNLTVATAGDWWDGVVDSGSATFYYVGIDSTGSIKFLGSTAPDKADTSGNTAGTKRYWYDGTKYWRVLGQIKVSASNVISPHFWYGSGDYYQVSWSTPISVSTTLSAGAWSSALSCSSGIPGISKLGVFGLYSSETGGTIGGIWLRRNGSTGSTANSDGIQVKADELGGWLMCDTDSSQQIQYQNNTGDDVTAITVKGYVGQR